MAMREKTKNRIISFLVFGAGAWFIFLCCLNYFAQRIGMDEGYILDNIKELSIPRLFGQLKYDQVFPRVYLALISVFSRQFSYSLLSLRFFPLLFMFAGFLIWVNIYKRESKSGFFLFLLILTFASSFFTTYYAALLKQYSGDLFAIAAFVLFIYCQKRFLNKETSLTNLWLFSLICPFLVLFSQMSFLLLWVPVYNYIFMAKEDRKAVAPFVGYFLLIMILSTVVYFTDIRYSRQVRFMQEYWNNCFIDTGSSYGFSKTFTNGLQNLFTRWFVENKLAKSLAAIFMPFALVAAFRSFKPSLVKHQGALMDINSLTGVLLLELFILGVLRVYPFTGARITLFMAPFIFFMLVKGIYLTRRIKLVFYPLAGAYLFFLSGVSAYLFCFYLGFYAK